VIFMTAGYLFGNHLRLDCATTMGIELILKWRVAVTGRRRSALPETQVENITVSFKATSPARFQGIRVRSIPASAILD